jgi:hypothetical protein
LDRAVRPSDFEVVDASLTTALQVATAPPSGLSSSFTAYREARSNEERVTALGAIRGQFDNLGLPSTHPVIAAVAARLIRHGSTQATDLALCRLVHAWTAAEAELGIELEASAFAFSQRRSDTYDALVVTGSDNNREVRRFAALASALWVRGWRARAEGLSVYTPFTDFAPSDRLALARYRAAAAAGVRVDADGWQALAIDQLVTQGAVVLESASPIAIADAIRELTTESVDTGALLLHPAVLGVDSHADLTRATLVFGDGVDT